MLMFADVGKAKTTVHADWTNYWMKHDPTHGQKIIDEAEEALAAETAKPKAKGHDHG